MNTGIFTPYFRGVFFASVKTTPIENYGEIELCILLYTYRWYFEKITAVIFSIDNRTVVSV